jgi:hypothetical protein
MLRAEIAGVVVLACAGAATATTVLSNNFAPGDSFTNAGGSNQGQAVGSSGWYYNNVRNGGVAGINTTYARSGNGSAYLETKVGPGGASSKADIEFLANGTGFAGNFFAGGSLGALANLNLNALSYEWYRDGTSTNSSVQHPAFRILLDADGNLATTGDRGGLVYERAYNALSTPTDSWVSDAITGSSKVWNFGLGAGLGFEHVIPGANGGNGTPYNPVTTWQAYLPNAAVLGFSMGVGSGWGPFKGAVDNVTFGFNGGSTTYNFEAAVIPLPAAAWAGLALLGVAGVSRRRNVA